jgi:hypothetical protein
MMRPMKPDLYTKAILTLIAALLAAHLFYEPRVVSAQSGYWVKRFTAANDGLLKDRYSSAITGTIVGVSCVQNDGCIAVGR